MRPVPILTAPTAAGKTALGVQLALAHGQVEVVSADAFLVYRGLDIGTAKPTTAERRGVPHHLLDVVDVTENYDVARYVRQAEAATLDILARGRCPLVVGGTGFYLAALIRGLPRTPKSDPAARASLEQELADRGLDALLTEMAAVNPAEAQRMERNPRRVLRSLEVYRQSGRWPGEFGHTAPAFRYQVTAYTWPADVLGERIRQRTAQMFAAGWPQEARWLAAQVDPDARPQATAWQTLGYAQALAAAQGRQTTADAAAEVTQATQGYAKRQRTFIRTQLGATLLTPQDAQAQLRAQLQP